MANGFADRKSARAAREAALWRASMLDDSSREEKAAFDAWLDADPAHPVAYAEAARLSQLAARLPGPARAAKRSGARLILRPAFALGAAAILALGVLAWTSQPDRGAAYASVTNPGLATRAVRLDDGSTVVLDAGTKLAVGFSSDARAVRLESGRVRVNVAHDGDRPFSITAGRAIATAGPALVDVSFVNGVARIWSLSGMLQAKLIDDAQARGQSMVLLSPGEATQLGSSGFTPLEEAALDRRWPVARLSFDRTPLFAIVRMANRIGSPPIRLADDDLGALEVTGVLDLRQTRPLARKLAAALDLRVDERADAIILAR